MLRGTEKRHEKPLGKSKGHRLSNRFTCNFAGVIRLTVTTFEVLARFSLKWSFSGEVQEDVERDEQGTDNDCPHNA